MAEGEKAYQKAEDKPLVLTEEVCGSHSDMESLICCGDNMTVMKSLLLQKEMAGKVQMIYIDPPFYSKSNYDAVIKAGDENIKYHAYDDKWEQGISAYLKMLTARLYLMRDLLADTGLLWLHLDWHVVHYAKILMDEIFGEKNFVNEIIWNYKSGGTSKKHFSRKHDTILVYAKSRRYQFYPLQEKSYNRGYKPYRFKGVREYEDDLGWYTMVNMKDVWNIDMVGRTSKERTGYATQKPEQLIQRMIESCTREGDLCADFFCGSGTLPSVAEKMGRRFIGCDLGSLACESTIHRLIEQEASFQVYRLAGNASAKGSNMAVQLNLKREFLPDDKVRQCISLISLKERKLSGVVEDKARANLEKILAEDSLQMVDSWSVDFAYNPDDGVHRPQAVFVREKGRLETTCEQITALGSHISVKVVDILGNTTFERFLYEGNSKRKTD